MLGAGGVLGDLPSLLLQPQERQSDRPMEAAKAQGDQMPSPGFSRGPQAPVAARLVNGPSLYMQDGTSNGK